ncbi:MAG: carbohydrate ABC transporter substrate-binding protein [Lachnospiraceae bacterium]|nr:carbohydrate ABC transporter substrate-binding protein [Lachnospiraceae bacterium]
MSKWTKIGALLLAGCFATGLMSGCGEEETKENKIVLMNFKPEAKEVYETIADEYYKKTGVTVEIISPEDGTYDETLAEMMESKDQPSIIQLNGYVSYDKWKDCCENLISTSLYTEMTDQSMVISSATTIDAVPFALEGYGIIYNDAVLEKYFALTDRGTKFNSISEVDSYNEFEMLVEDMTAHKEELGIEGVFASTSLAENERWRWSNHLSNLPLYYEIGRQTSYANYMIATIATREIKFTYENEFKNIFDLYIENSCTPKMQLQNKTTADSMAEFAAGKCAMVQNGSWSYQQIATAEGKVVEDEDIKIMPIYIGAPGESSQGICISTESYYAVNKNISDDEKEKAIDFLEWMYTTDEGATLVASELGFYAPYKKFDKMEYSNPLINEVLEWNEKDGINNVPWLFPSYPSEEFKDALGNDLLDYVNQNITWKALVANTKENWAK